jgi:2-keto-4-pentenoate hydratase/2-oxohepta-3-ene-1,7-dioic acid hydratase in catechol pathway
MAHWIRFVEGTTEHFGTLEGSTIQVYSGEMFGNPVALGRTTALEAVRLLAPVRPGKYIGLWNNFRALAEKLGNAIPVEPLCFLKANNSYLDPGASFRKPRSYEGRIAFKGELGVVLGRRCADVDERGAQAAIFGYTCVNDLTAIDLLNRDGSFPQWMRAKSFDGFGPIGPAIATDLDWSELRIRTIVDGIERQNYSAADMILSPPRIVSQLSREMTLVPGDLIACGTSLGVKTLKPGSSVEVVIDGIGSLRNIFAEDAR